MRIRVGAFGAMLLATTLLGSEVGATRTRFFRIEGFEALSKGKMRAVAVDGDGSVAAGLGEKMILDNAGTQVWSLLRAPDGSILVGTGSEGQVFLIDEKGPRPAAQVFEYEVFAVAADARGRIYAGGAPNGTISLIGREGSTTTCFDTPEGIVWSLLPDNDGNLYAATGERGAIYRIKADGSGSVLYRPEDDHVTALAWSPRGKLIAGTDGRGLVIEIDPNSGEARVLYDSPLSEIADLLVGSGGEIYFAANGSVDPARGGDGAHLAAEAGTTSLALLSVLEPNGTVRDLWRCPTETIHAIAPAPGGDLWVGTGSTAAVYRITPAGDETLIWKPEEGQVLALLSDGSALYAGTGNPGRVYRLASEETVETWIRPEPLDAGSSVAWGRASWQVLGGKGAWELRTRSGFTSQPDSSWSGWTDPLTDPEGSLVTSPAARFLQCEARFRGDGSQGSAKLRTISIPYSEANLPPRLKAIILSPDEPAEGSSGAEAGFLQDLGGGVKVQFQKEAGPGEPALTQQPPEWVRAVRSITWQAFDPNEDVLSFEVALRQVGDERFRVIAREHPATSYAFDTRNLPDGRYEIRVVASDAPSNPPGEALRAERISGPFHVDHRPPEFLDLKVRREGDRRLIVEGSAQDEASPIVRLEVSWDTSAWRPAPALDGFYDSRTESFRVEIQLDKEEDGAWVAARAVDAAGNEGVRRAWLAP